MVFRIAAGLLGVGIVWMLASGYQDGEFTPRKVLMMLSLGGIFLAYALMGPKRLQGIYTSVVGDDEAGAEEQDQEGETGNKP
ncbi:MAG: hypothetical protein JRJ82_14085 [Deltaproteobacteria bacterium]|nr:hypothetical protein [Deltaproteobacteria bacterium]